MRVGTRANATARARARDEGEGERKGESRGEGEGEGEGDGEGKGKGKGDTHACVVPIDTSRFVSYSKLASHLGVQSLGCLHVFQCSNMMSSKYVIIRSGAQHSKVGIRKSVLSDPEKT